MTRIIGLLGALREFIACIMAGDYPKVIREDWAQ